MSIISPGHRRLSSGFTLIELLVVIAIIGMIASVILAAVNSSGPKARDAVRGSQLQEFEQALELYYSANNHYPYTCGGGDSEDASFEGCGASQELCTTPGGTTYDGNTLTTEMAPYIGPLLDPKSLGGCSGWNYKNSNLGSASSYCIIDWLTPENLNDFSRALWYNPYGGRCTGLNASGQCNAASSGSPNNEIWYGVGNYASGC